MNEHFARQSAGRPYWSICSQPQSCRIRLNQLIDRSALINYIQAKFAYWGRRWLATTRGSGMPIML